MNTQTRDVPGAAAANEIFFPDFADPGFQRNPYPAYRAARERAPIFWSPRHRQYLALGAGAVRGCLQSPDFIVDSPFRASRRLFGRTIMDVDGNEHTRLRILANKGFVPGRYEAYKQRYVVPIIEELAGRLHARGGGNFVAEFADQIPSHIMAHVIGIPAERWQHFHRLSTPIIDYLDTASPERLRAAQASYAVLTEIVLPVIDAKLAEPDETIIGELARARSDGKELSYEEIVRQIGLMIPAAIDTTNRLIANALYLLASDPSSQERLRADDGLLPAYVEEVMRFEPPIHSSIRICARDTVVEGLAIPKGALVNVVFAAGNRDPATFPDPDRFDPERPELRRHLSFGGGKHQCIGRFFAVIEVTEALRALLRRPGRLAFASESPAPIYGAAFRSPPRLDLIFV
jgi:cytochrome P450